MIIGKQIKEILETMPQGMVFTIADFNIPQSFQPALVKTLSRLVAAGTIQKISKGKYYKPKQTVFGALRPPIGEVVKDLLERGGKLSGYITGTAAFAQMGLTTQISSAILIGTNKYKRPLNRGEYTISFIVQPNAITEGNIHLLRMLDAIKLIKEIPASSPDDCVQVIGRLIRALPEDERKMLVMLAINYAPHVRALLGAIMDSIRADSYGLRDTLNGVTTYKLPVSSQVLPTKSTWHIV